MTDRRFEVHEGGATNGRANERSIGDVAAELKNEIKDFLQTRIDILRSEMQEKAKRFKMALPLLLVGAVLAGVAFVVLTFALIAAVSLAFEGMRSPWALAALIVGLAYLLIGGVAALVGWRELRLRDLAPKRTMRVLQEDQAWLQSEAAQAKSQARRMV